MNAMKLGLRDTERPIYAAHDTIPVPQLPDFGELTLPAPEVPPTQPALPEDEEPESEECEVCAGSGGLEAIPASAYAPAEYVDCWNCHGSGVL